MKKHTRHGLVIFELNQGVIDVVVCFLFTLVTRGNYFLQHGMFCSFVSYLSEKELIVSKVTKEKEKIYISLLSHN